MNSKRILTIFVLFALLIATTSVAFASEDVDLDTFDDESEIDIDDVSDDDQDDTDDSDDEYLDDTGDEDLDDSDDEYLDDTGDEDLDDSDDEDWEDDSYDEDLDDSDDEDWEDDSYDEDLDDSEDEDYEDENIDDEDWEDYDDEDGGWTDVEEWDEVYEDGMKVHIYKTVTYTAKGQIKYMASSCSYTPDEDDNESYDDENRTDYEYDEYCEEMMYLATFLATKCPLESQIPEDYFSAPSVSKSIDQSFELPSESHSDKNTSTDTKNVVNEPANTQTNDYGIFGLLLALLLSIIVLI